MELREAIGRRRSIRFLLPHKPVEREKIQKMLEAATLSSFWGNVRALRAVVIERATAPQDVLDALPPGSAIGGFQLHLAPVLIVWYLNWRALREQGKRLHELVDAGAAGLDREASHRYLDETLIPFFDAAAETMKSGRHDRDGLRSRNRSSDVDGLRAGPRHLSARLSGPEEAATRSALA